MTPTILSFLGVTCSDRPVICHQRKSFYWFISSRLGSPSTWLKAELGGSRLGHLVINVTPGFKVDNNIEIVPSLAGDVFHWADHSVGPGGWVRSLFHIRGVGEGAQVPGAFSSGSILGADEDGG